MSTTVYGKFIGSIDLEDDFRVRVDISALPIGVQATFVDSGPVPADIVSCILSPDAARRLVLALHEAEEAMAEFHE